MTVFLDTGNIDEIKKYHEYGIIRGVTTNPSILVKEDLGSSIEDIKYKLIEIADLIKPLPLSIEVTSNDLSKMTDEAELFSSCMGSRV